VKFTVWMLCTGMHILKVKQFLCLLNQAPRDEDVWERGGIASQLDRDEWSDSHRFRLERVPTTYCIGGWVSPRVDLDITEKNLLLLPGIEFQLLGIPVRSLSLFWQIHPVSVYICMSVSLLIWISCYCLCKIKYSCLNLKVSQRWL
jgi:hypothetical protein